ncbi:hypothetical protein [Cytobacillus oceanisediminis]|uniref:hypothetical protein n=1 Tax=Cytobacillus oceanisediminis TaxID=665099 RepID=UPI00203D11F9|nr:hypothetical protein [Cytobacillus oceanisediminis]MCM3404924.1 hypothetical protein [Cytobacillus oceanisediminis]
MDNTNERIKLIQDDIAQSVEDYGDYELAKIDSEDAYWLISTIKQQQQEIEVVTNLKKTLEEANHGMQGKIEEQQQEIERYKEYAEYLQQEIQWQYGKLNQISDLIEKSRNESQKLFPGNTR